MRDKIKDKKYFQEYIDKRRISFRKRSYKLNNGLIKPERIIPVKLSMLSSLISIMKAKYSLGDSLKSLEEEYFQIIGIISEYWSGNLKFVGPKNKVLDQYSLERYDEMLWMLSLGYLLNIPNESFNVLVSAIEKDNVRDRLFEFIISAKKNSSFDLKEESYKYGWKLFSKLRQAILESSKKNAEMLIGNFLEEDWYEEHKNTGWYQNHKNKFNTYSGYWCFESAAIVCILGLDDSSFRDNHYYPKDLVDYYRSTSKVLSN